MIKLIVYRVIEFPVNKTTIRRAMEVYTRKKWQKQMDKNYR